MLDSQVQLLHRLAPYLPTDRFRALLMGKNLPETSTGAAMIVDISGFTPLTVSLVKEFGPQRASEELKRKLNPMFEAIGGLVFTHGGSVIRFVGDGFTAWFADDLDHTQKLTTPLPGIVRAAVAGLEMLEMMVFFKQLDLKVAINHGVAQRWVVGDDHLGLVDILAGVAVERVAETINHCDRHQARAHPDNLASLRQQPHLHFDQLEDGDLLLKRASSLLIEHSRAHRWDAWQAVNDVETVLGQVKKFIDPLIENQETSGLGTWAGELRYATPMFLRFAGLDYNNDPEAAHKLGQYLKDVQYILDDTKGRLVSLEVADKGSVIFAVYGAPISHGDDSKRAIHAALTLRDLPQIHPYITHQNLGISRGLLYSGTVGGEVRHEYTSLGDETNVASRLMSADHAGKILVSKAVYEECIEWFDFEEGGIITPKGRIGSIPTYTPLRVNERVKRNQRKTPLVGRDSELAVIQKAFNNVGVGRPQILRIEGEAGIGKSRLAAEITHFSAENKRIVAIGYCVSTGKSTPFLPWRNAMRSILALNEDWSPATIIAHLENWLTERNEAWVARLPLLGELLGITIEDTNTTRSLTGSARQQALFSLIIDMLYFQAKQNPITLILEDTHWLDEVSENLTIELISRLTIQAAPLLLVLLHRSAEEAKHPPALLKALEETYLHKHLSLGMLSRTATGELIGHHTGGIIPDDLIDFVFEKSQGNAFFILEILGTLLANDFIKRVGPRVYIENDLAKINLPQTVQGLILARLDNLNENDKMTLKLASVIGKQFEIRVLFQSLPLKRRPDDVMRYIRSLEQQQFVTLETLYPEPIYSFRHAITQEVTYQTLLYDQRREWHHNVGEVLERLQSTNWERLAYHFSQTDDKERAFIYLARAGDRSARDFANQAALNYWEQALNLARSPKETFDLLCKRLEVLMRTGDFKAIETDLKYIIQLADATPQNLNWQLRKARYLAEHAANINDWEKARQYSDEGVEIGKQYRESQILWEIYSIQTRVYSHLRDETLKQEATHRLREIAIELNDPIKSLRLIMNDLLELATLDPQIALDNLEALYPQLAQENDPLLEANFWNNVSQIAMQNGFHARAESALRTQLQLWRQVGNRRLEGNTLYHLGSTLYTLGQYSTAGGYLRESYTIATQVADRWGEAQVLVALGSLAFRRGAFGEAAAYIDRGLAYYEQNKVKLLAGRALYMMGQVQLAQDNPEAARPYLRRALPYFAESNHYDGIPQVEAALAYASALTTTLPFWDDVEASAAALINKNFNSFLAPDLAFWQVYYLHLLFRQDITGLRDAFQTYLEINLAPLETDEARQAFLEIGHIRELIANLRL